MVSKNRTISHASPPPYAVYKPAMDHAGGNTSVSSVTNPPGIEQRGPRRRPAAGGVERFRPEKRVDVTVTVLSIAGLHVKDESVEKKKKKKKRGGGLMSKMSSSRNNNNNGGNDAIPTDGCSTPSEEAVNNEVATTIVASFSRVVNAGDGEPRTVMTHVPSLPLPPTSSSNKASSNSNLVVRWPDHGGRALSSYTFQRTFQREDLPSDGNERDDVDSSTARYEPQPLAIQIAISRAGRMFKLGTARVLLSGEEDGGLSVNVPVRGCIPARSSDGGGGAPTKSSKFRVLSRSGSRECVVPVARLRGDTLKCGLDPSATLRVLVRVGEPMGETPMDISPRLTVTTVISTSPGRQTRTERDAQKKRETGGRLPLLPTTPFDTPADARENATAADSDDEYDPSLAAVVPKSPVEATNGNHAAVVGIADVNEEPMVRVFSTKEDAYYESNYRDNDYHDEPDDEPSCTSSAYMSFVADDHHYQSRYPTKGRMARSRSTATASTARSEGFSIVSDLTSHSSFASQLSLGVEVVPLALDARGDASAMLDRIELPPDSRLRFYEEEAEKEEGKYKSDRTTLTAAEARSLPNSIKSNSPLPSFSRFSSSSAMAVAAPRKASGWRQRLACAMPAACGSAASVDDYLMVSGVGGVRGGVHGGGFDGARPSVAYAEAYAGDGRGGGIVGRRDPLEAETDDDSYWTEDEDDNDDVSLAEYDDGGSGYSSRSGSASR